MKNTKIKRFFSLVLAMALAFVFTVGTACVSAETIENNATATINPANNLFNNGNFETGDKSSWLNEEGATFTVTNEDKFGGNYSLKIVKDDASAAIKNYSYFAKGNTQYTVSYRVKNANGNIQVLPIIGQYTSDWVATDGGAKWLGAYAVYGVTDGWTFVTFDITTAADTEILEFGIAANEQAGISYIDDVMAVEKTDGGEDVFSNGSFDNGSGAGWSMGASQEIPPEMDEYDAFVNGTFEENTNAWALNNDVRTADEAHNGSYSLKLVGESWNYGANLTPGLEYTYTAYIKVTDAEEGFSVYPYIWDFGDIWLNADSMRVSENCDWTEVSYTFTAPSPDPSSGIRLGFVQSGTGNAYIDDITLIHRELKPLTTTTELFANKNFANGKSGWDFSANSEIINDNGINTVKMTVAEKGSEYIQQTVSVVPGKTYDFAADLMTQEQDGNDAQAQVYVIDKNWNMVCPSVYKTYGWMHLSATYTAPEDVTSVTVLLQHNEVAGVSFWKNVSFSLTEIQTEETRQDVFTNGGFETVINGTDAFAYNITSAVAQLTTENVHSGSYAMKYESGYFTNYGTNVEPGTYTLSMWVNTVSGETAEVSGFVSGCGIPWLDFAMTPAANGVTNGWVQISGQVTFSEAGTPQFGFKNYGVSGEIYFDDIKLEKVTYTPKYPTTSYSEGIGLFGGANGMLKADTTNEWWNFATSVTAGQKYKYSMDVKIENAQPGFVFCPYIYNFSDSWQQDTVYYDNTDWVHYEFEFTAAIPNNDYGTRFGFVRRGTGTVYIDNITLISKLNDTEIDETLITNGNFANGLVGWEQNGSCGTDTLSVGDGLTGKGALVNHFAENGAISYSVRTSDYLSVESGATYIVKVYVKSSGNVTLGASFRANSQVTDIPTQYSGIEMTGDTAWQLITYRMTVPENVDWDGIPGVKLQLDMIFEDSNASVFFDDAQMYREYAYGDANGDGKINIKDIVRYKKAFAELSSFASNTYADVNEDLKVDTKDMVDLIKYLFDDTRTLGPVYFK